MDTQTPSLTRKGLSQARTENPGQDALNANPADIQVGRYQNLPALAG